MHETTFTDALLPTAVSVLRLPLKPYSLGHEILLLRQRNAFLTHSESDFNRLTLDEQKRHLRMAVVICSNSWADNHRRIRGIGFWGWMVRNAVYPIEIANFRIYLAEAYETVFRTLNPKCEEDVRADDICADAAGYEAMHKMRGRSLGAPLIARLLQFAANDRMFAIYGHVTPYDFPYAAAMNFYLAYLEGQGSARIEGAAEAEAKRAWAADVEWAKEEERKAEIRKQAENPTAPHTGPLAPAGLATTPPDLDADETSTINAAGGEPPQLPD